MQEPYFHVGILVRDVEAARADFTAKLGVEFEPVHSHRIACGETTRPIGFLSSRGEAGAGEVPARVGAARLQVFGPLSR